MTGHLGDYFRARRRQKGLTTGQLARLAGYSNLSRGSNRIRIFEAGGKVAPDLVAKLTSALDISPDEVRRLVSADHREWLRWADEPVRPYLVIRHTACVYERVELIDDDLRPEAAEARAARLARGCRRMVCLVMSRTLSIGFDSSGREYRRLEATPDVTCEPYAAIGHRRVRFVFSEREVLRPSDEPGR